MFRKKNIKLNKKIKPFILFSRVDSSTINKRQKTFRLKTNVNSIDKKIFNDEDNKTFLRKNSTKTLTNFNSTNISNEIKIFKNKNNNSFITNNNNNIKTNYNSENSTNCRNLISIKERKLIREKTLNLKLNYSLSNQNSTISKNNKTFINNNNNSTSNSHRTQMLLKKESLASFLSNDSSINNNNNNNNKNKLIKYPLKQLMKLDPYRLTSPHVYDNIKLYKKLNKFHLEPKIFGTKKTFDKNSIKTLGTCSILIKKNPHKNKTFLLQRLIKIRSNELDLNKNFLILIKWECIFKLFNLHMINIVLLVKSYNEMKFFFDKNLYISKMKFKELLLTIGAEIKNEHENFIDFCYEIFSIDNGKTIFIKDFFTALIIGTQKMLYDEKIKFFCNIWKNEENNILILDMLFCIKNNLIYFKDYDKIFSFFKNHKEKFIFCDEVFDLFVNNIQLRKIYMRNVILDLYNIDKNYNNHVNKIINVNMKNLNNNFDNNCCYFMCLNDIKKMKKIIENMKEKQKKNFLINKKLNEINNNEN